MTILSTTGSASPAVLPPSQRAQEPVAALVSALERVTAALAGLVAALTGADALGGGAVTGAAQTGCHRGVEELAPPPSLTPSIGYGAPIAASVAAPSDKSKPAASSASTVLGGGGSDAHKAAVERAQKRATTSGIGNVVAGKISWYGGPNDREDNDKPASGVPNTVPGIAVMNSKTLGGWWEVTMSDGKKVQLQQTDIGPAKWTGKMLDFNHTAVKQLGYTEKSFPTGGTASARYLGPNPR
ncbi:MAG: hypothetical protein ABI200_02530 [Gaiellales bacterium]